MNSLRLCAYESGETRVFDIDEYAREVPLDVCRE